METFLDWAAEASVQELAALSVGAAVLVVLAVLAQRSALRLRRELLSAEEELVDEKTGLLPQSAIPVRLGIELTWSQSTGAPLSVAVFRIRGARFEHAARVLRHEMRGEEQGFLLGEQQVLIELWGTGVDAAGEATRRLGVALAAAGHPVVDAGVATSPRDGIEPEELIAAARRDLRPVDDPVTPGSELGSDGRAASAGARAVSLLTWVLPWFALQIALLTTTWLLLPASIEPAIDGTGVFSRSAGDILVALVTLVGLPAGVALAHFASWNLGGGRAPSSRPHGPARWITAAVLAAAVFVPLAWATFLPDLGDGGAIGSTLAMFVLVVIALVHARQLVSAPSWVLVPLLALGVLGTWTFVELSDMPLAANAGRLVAAAALGALLARYIERVSWLVGLALLAAGVDLWSVFSDSGLTNSLLEDAGSSSEQTNQIVDFLLFTGPSIDGSPLFQLGVTDLVFLAVFLSWSHDWRLDMRVVIASLVASTWAVVLFTVITDEAVPALPALTAAMLLVLGVRSALLSSRERAWKRDSGAPKLGTPAAG